MEDVDTIVCPTCNGSGHGEHSGDTCGGCAGLGVVYPMDAEE